MKYLRGRLWCSEDRFGWLQRVPDMFMNFKRSIDYGTIDECARGCVFLQELVDPPNCAAVTEMRSRSFVLEVHIAGPGLRSLSWCLTFKGSPF